MKKYYKYILIFVICFIITFLYNFFLLNVNCDEIWNYGFSYNMIHGLVPYRDFNVVVTPLFFMIGSWFILIFGNHIYAYDIYVSIIVSVICLLCYVKMGRVGILLIPIITTHFGPSYNALCFLLCFIVLLLYDIDIKNKDFLIGLLIGCIFLTKQSIGVVLLFVMLLCSLRRLKALGGFLIPNLIFVIYLIYNDAFFGFIDYCFLGLLDFNQSNLNVSVAYMPIFVIVFIIIVVSYIWSGFKNGKLLYILGFQSVAYPIFDAYHVMLGVMLYLIYLFDIYKDKLDKNFKYYFVMGCAFFISYCTFPLDDYHLYRDRDSFLYGRGIFDSVGQKTSNYDMIIKELKESIVERMDDYDKVFIFSLYRTDFAYVCKLDLGIPIFKFDLINNGNMGYYGEEKYILELNNMCIEERCLFFVDDFDINSFGQANIGIVNNVVNNYKKLDDIEGDFITFSVYGSDG